MATREEQDLDALNVKVNAILEHLGIEVPNAHSDRAQAQAKAAKYWAEGGEGWRAIHGKPSPEDEEAARQEAEAQAENQKAIVATEQQRQAQIMEAAILEAENKAQEAQAAIDAQNEAIKAQAVAVAERANEAKADNAKAEEAPRNNRGNK